MRTIHPLILDPEKIHQAGLPSGPAIMEIGRLFGADAADHPAAGITLRDNALEMRFVLDPDLEETHSAYDGRDVLRHLFDSRILADRPHLAELLYRLQAEHSATSILARSHFEVLEKVLCPEIFTAPSSGTWFLALTPNLLAFYRFDNLANSKPTPTGFATPGCNFTPELGDRIKGLVPDTDLVMPIFDHRCATLTAHERVARHYDLDRELRLIERIALKRGHGDVEARFVNPLRLPHTDA